MVFEDEQLSVSARLLRSFHDATAGSELADSAEVVCHNDFGPWNLVWRDELPVAIIDFDNAAPGARIDDLGYALWKHLNLGLIELAATEEERRLSLMAEAYGVPVDAGLVAAIARAQTRMQRQIEAAPAGERRATALTQLHREREWLRANGSALLDGD